MLITSVSNAKFTNYLQKSGLALCYFSHRNKWWKTDYCCMKYCWNSININTYKQAGCSKIALSLKNGTSEGSVCHIEVFPLIGKMVIDGRVFREHEHDWPCDIPSGQYCSFLPFQQLEIVPLYGDMQVAPFHYIKKSKNFDPSKWPNCESSQLSPQSNILANLEPIREDHMSYISQLSRHSNEVCTSLMK